MTGPDDVIRIRLSGEFDVPEIPEFEKRIGREVETGNLRLLVDLSGLSFVSSSGVSCILRVRDTVRGRGGEIALVAPQGLVEKILHLLELPFFPDEAGAMRCLREGE